MARTYKDTAQRYGAERHEDVRPARVERRVQGGKAIR